MCIVYFYYFNLVFNKSILYSLSRYFLNLGTKFHHKKSILGALLLFLVAIQCVSGVMVSFSYISEPMLVPSVRNEEDMGDLYTDDFFWIHERLVDIIFFTMYCHMYKKISYTVYTKHQINAWVSGATLWLFMHVSIFLGLCLCCTHLSDITLTIAANLIYTFCMKTGKLYWVLFTDQTLNSDTIIRLAYFHYVISLFIFFLSFFHAFEMHYDWKDQLTEDGIPVSLSWLYASLKHELSFMLEWFFIFYLFGKLFYTLNECLSYEIFMWGDIGMVTDPRFLGVAPHWYFRAYMGWLIVCPHHYIGIFGLALYIVIIYFQIYLKKLVAQYNNNNPFFSNLQYNLLFIISFAVFIVCLLYTSSILPYGKFFNRIYGNIALLLSYFFVLIYLTKVTNLFFIQFFSFYRKTVPLKKENVITEIALA